MYKDKNSYHNILKRCISMKEKKGKEMHKNMLEDGVIKTYDFVPEYNRWLDMETQRNIVKKLENITNDEKEDKNI